MMNRLFAILLLFLVIPLCTAQSPESVRYNWKNVQIAGGGFVDGIIFHPTAKGVRYARTDIGGAYRWNDKAGRWEPLLDWLSYEDANLMGVESLALDPSDPDRVYLACGTYTSPGAPNGAVLSSSDRGRTFNRADVPFKFGANENGRGNGERMAVDPNDGRIILLGTRNAGLWASRDHGLTWKRIDSFPDVSEPEPDRSKPGWREQRGSGINLVLFDSTGGSKGKPSSTIYVAVSLMDGPNLFRSTDGGKTWAAVRGAPTQYRPTHGVLASDGTLYLTYGDTPGPSQMRKGAVWKLNTNTGQWTDITPARPGDLHRFGYAAVAVDPRSPQTIIVSTFGRHTSSGPEDDILRSTDGGRNWKSVFESGASFDSSRAPYVAATPIHWLFDLVINPRNPDHALFTTGYGVWETFNLRNLDVGRPTRWSLISTGIEETVALSLLSPSEGAPLISAIGDYAGFVHWDLDKPAPQGEYNPPYFDNTTGLANAEDAPGVVVRVGRPSAHHRGHGIGYSLDGGRTWAEPASLPAKDAQSGSIAVSSDGRTWVWSPERSAVTFTRDRGTTWADSEGIPAGTRVIADGVNPQKFYAVSIQLAKLFVSTDAGASFREMPLLLPDGPPLRSSGDWRGGQNRIYATPGHEGDLWLAASSTLYHSVDGGKVFRKADGIDVLHAFGFGRGAPGTHYPALYLVGTVKGQRGIFRSDDSAPGWLRINDTQHQWGLVLQISGDPKRYGRVYVGTHGRGIFYGDPVK